jgi:DNA repair protein RadC
MNPGHVLTEPLIAEIMLSYTPRFRKSDLPLIKKAEDAYPLFLSTWDQSKIEFIEQFKVMLLNRANRVLGICTLSSGSSTQCVVDIRTLFAAALKANATGIILAHNHPSLHLKPSTNDLEITRKIKEGANYLELQVLDHLIISPEGFLSFADQGLF